LPNQAAVQRTIEAVWRIESARLPRAATAADTDWGRIVGLYDTLGGLNPSPVIELNRAVAVAMADSATGPARASRATRPCAATTCCPRSGATCSPGWAGGIRRARSSSGRPPSPPTTASAPTCSAAPPRQPPPRQPPTRQTPPPTTHRARARAQLYGVVVDTLTSPDRSRIGRENSVESLLMYFLPIRSADRARSAVSAR